MSRCVVGDQPPALRRACAIGPHEPPFHHSSHAVRPTLCPIRPRFLCRELLERGTPRRSSFGGRVRRVGFFDRAHRGGRFVEAARARRTRIRWVGRDRRDARCRALAAGDGSVPVRRARTIRIPSAARGRRSAGVGYERGPREGARESGPRSYVWNRRGRDPGRRCARPGRRGDAHRRATDRAPGRRRGRQLERRFRRPCGHGRSGRVRKRHLDSRHRHQLEVGRGRVEPGTDRGRGGRRLCTLDASARRYRSRRDSVRLDLRSGRCPDQPVARSALSRCCG